MIIANSIQLKTKIGDGSYGEVYLGVDKNTNKKYAIKKVPKKKLLDNQIRLYFNNEMYILKHLQSHPNIIKFYSIETTISNYYIIEEYCNGGNLTQILTDKLNKDKKPLSEEDAKYITKNILKGLSNLNSQNIIHRDLKLDNIIFNYENQEDLILKKIKKAQIKIIDFGFARYLEKNEKAESILGTPVFMDPNILNNLYSQTIGYNKKADIWSIGVITYIMLTGNLPFDGHSCEDLFKSIKERKYIIPRKYDLLITKGCIDFIDKVLNIDINERPSAEELLLNDPWINDTNDKYDLYSLKKDFQNVNYLSFLNYWEKKNFCGNKNLRKSKSFIGEKIDKRKKRIDDLLEKLLNNNIEKKRKINKVEINDEFNEETVKIYYDNDNNIQFKYNNIDEEPKTPSQLENTNFTNTYNLHTEKTKKTKNKI